jgi:hypothetical protein
MMNFVDRKGSNPTVIHPQGEDVTRKEITSRTPWFFPWPQYLPLYHLDPKDIDFVTEVRCKFTDPIRISALLALMGRTHVPILTSICQVEPLILVDGERYTGFHVSIYVHSFVRPFVRSPPTQQNCVFAPDISPELVRVWIDSCCSIILFEMVAYALSWKLFRLSRSEL